MLRRALLAIAVGAPLGLAAQAAEAQEVTVGYQLIYSPWALPIAQETFEKETGYDVNWVKFDSGAG